MKIIQDSFAEIYGKPCWGLKYDSQTNLSLNFGEPHLEIREPFQAKSKSRDIIELFAHRQVKVKGEYWLWLFICYWRLSFNGIKAASNRSPIRLRNKAVWKLDGQILTNVTVDSESGSTTFDFDLGAKLQVRSWERKSDDELWLLYKPDNYVLTVRADGFYTHSLRTENNEEKYKLTESGL